VELKIHEWARELGKTLSKKKRLLKGEIMKNYGETLQYRHISRRK